MHIGIPLVVLLLMWIHVQRMPKARTNPPRPLMLSVVLTLMDGWVSRRSARWRRPASAYAGQPAARLVLPCGLPTPLPVAAGQVWALLGTATALVVALPWLPPSFKRGRAGNSHTGLRHLATGGGCARARLCSTPVCAKVWLYPTSAETVAVESAGARYCTEVSTMARISATHCRTHCGHRVRR